MQGFSRRRGILGPSLQEAVPGGGPHKHPRNQPQRQGSSALRTAMPGDFPASSTLPSWHLPLPGPSCLSLLGELLATLSLGEKEGYFSNQYSYWLIAAKLRIP